MRRGIYRILFLEFSDKIIYFVLRIYLYIIPLSELFIPPSRLYSSTSNGGGIDILLSSLTQPVSSHSSSSWVSPFNFTLRRLNKHPEEDDTVVTSAKSQTRPNQQKNTANHRFRQSNEPTRLSGHFASTHALSIENNTQEIPSTLPILEQVTDLLIAKGGNNILSPFCYCIHPARRWGPTP